MVRGIPPRTMLRMLREKSVEGGVPERGEVRPKEWVYETRPVFKKVREPLVDVFKEAEEVRIIIDLGGFRRGEIDIEILPDRYVITAHKQEREFRKEIILPEDVDAENIEERFKNGILELVLPRKGLGEKERE